MADVQRRAARDRSGLYYRSQARAMERIEAQIRDRRYERRKVQQVGGYAGNGQVVIQGSRYRLEERGLSLTTGQQIVVENVGRPGAAVYVPVPQANEGL